MSEGDGWKSGGFEERRKMWNAQDMIALDEYTSIIHAYYDHVLRPIVQKEQKLDRYMITLTKSDLEWKMNNPDFKKLPFKTRNAYQNFMNFVIALETATDEEVTSCKGVLNGLFSLGIKCDVYGQELTGDGVYHGRNPCRDSQYVALSAINKAEIEGSSKLLESAKQMVETCLKCPYK